jgi:hypothetical protein
MTPATTLESQWQASLYQPQHERTIPWLLVKMTLSGLGNKAKKFEARMLTFTGMMNPEMNFTRRHTERATKKVGRLITETPSLKVARTIVAIFEFFNQMQTEKRAIITRPL